MTRSLLSIIVSCLSAFLTIKINYDLLQKYLSADGKTRMLFGIVEGFELLGYAYHFLSLILVSIILIGIGAIKKESKKILLTALSILGLSIAAIFVPFWRLMI